jgi:hypothetical protein
LGEKNLMHPFGRHLEDSWLRYKVLDQLTLNAQFLIAGYHHHHPFSFILARVNQHPLSTP